jgi:hypothetical protein
MVVVATLMEGVAMMLGTQEMEEEELMVMEQVVEVVEVPVQQPG